MTQVSWIQIGLIALGVLLMVGGWFLNLMATVALMIPALILFVLGLALLGLGALEIITPATFDQIGGGFLELLFREPS